MTDPYLAYLISEKRCSTHTIIAYQTDLKQFAEYLKHTFETDTLDEASPEMVRSWVVSLKDSGLSNRSINRKLSSLRNCYRFYIKNKNLAHDPTSGIQSLKSRNKLPVFMPGNDMQNLLDYCESQSGFTGTRDYLIIEVFYQTGMRRSELAQLCEQDIDFERSVIKVQGKGNKERIIPFHIKLNRSLRHYLDLKKQIIESPAKELFVNTKGKPLSTHMIYQIVNRLLKQFTSLSKTSPHVLRHTFATHLLNNGASLIAIRELLGHSNLAATEIYTHNSIDQLKKIHQQAHPKGQ